MSIENIRARAPPTNEQSEAGEERRWLGARGTSRVECQNVRSAVQQGGR